MASTNQSPFYQRAEQEFHEATTDEERIACLEIMIKECPKHKSSENMLKNLTTRLKKLKDKSAKQRKSGRSSQPGIKKADLQCVLAGFPNSGKSTLFTLLTGLHTKISANPFTTHQPKLGTFSFEETPIQVIDDAPFPHHNKSLINATDTVIIMVTSVDEIPKAEEFLYRSSAKKIIVFHKEDLLSDTQKRKISATIQSKFKKLPFILFSQSAKKDEVEKLKRMILKTFSLVRVYTKEPKKEPSKEPMILKPGAVVSDAAEKILKGMSRKVKRVKIWGPSSKFPGQVVGLDHVLKDKDVIELQTS